MKVPRWGRCFCWWFRSCRNRGWLATLKAGPDMIRSYFLIGKRDSCGLQASRKSHLLPIFSSLLTSVPEIT